MPVILRNGCGGPRHCPVTTPLIARGPQKSNSSGGSIPLPSRPGHGLNTPAGRLAIRQGAITRAQVAAARADDARRRKGKGKASGASGGNLMRGAVPLSQAYRAPSAARSTATSRRSGGSTATSHRRKKKRAPRRTAGQMHAQATKDIHNHLGKRGGNLKRL